MCAQRQGLQAPPCTGNLREAGFEKACERLQEITLPGDTMTSAVCKLAESDVADCMKEGKGKDGKVRERGMRTEGSSGGRECRREGREEGEGDLSLMFSSVGVGAVSRVYLLEPADATSVSGIEYYARRQ
eukprot:1324582-Rhodomonas_salina.1